jgi:hypothetical protein
MLPTRLRPVPPLRLHQPRALLRNRTQGFRIVRVRAAAVLGLSVEAGQRAECQNAPLATADARVSGVEEVEGAVGADLRL